MARVVRQSKVRERNGMTIQPAELIVMLAIIGVIIYGIRFYFVVYRNSPDFVLGEYFQAVKAGNVERQYELIDATDKQNYYPTQSVYEKNAPQSRGYTGRISKWSFSNDQTTSSGAVSVDASLSLRDSSAGKELYQSGSSDVEDQYMLKKNSSGQWRVVLSKSKNVLIKKIKPSAPGDPI